MPRYFSDAQIEQLERNPEFRVHGQKCVVCDDTGSYVYNGQKLECPDDDFGHAVMRLAKFYWLHNIPLQYQQLVWDEWPMNEKTYRDIKEAVDNYVANFEQWRRVGVGLIFNSRVQGTGKTWAATAALKGVLKSGHSGFFLSFKDIVDIDSDPELLEHLKTAELLVLDEVSKPYTDAQRSFFADRLERMIRPRTNSNFPTIMTTNLTEKEIEDTYPRVFSLLMLKNLWQDMNSLTKDARKGDVTWKRGFEAVANGESLPIT